jgi:hypothetical protein
MRRPLTCRAADTGISEISTNLGHDRAMTQTSATRIWTRALGAFFLLVALAAPLAGIPSAAIASGDAPKGDIDPREVELPAIVMPISVDGKLVNYLFVTLKVRVTAKADPWKIRDKAHVARDALVRAVHITPMTDPNNLKDFDRRKMQTVLKPALDRAFGAGTIESMRVIQLDSIKQVVRVPGAKK